MRFIIFCSRLSATSKHLHILMRKQKWDFVQNKSTQPSFLRFNVWRIFYPNVLRKSHDIMVQFHDIMGFTGNMSHMTATVPMISWDLSVSVAYFFCNQQAFGFFLAEHEICILWKVYVCNHHFQVPIVGESFTLRCWRKAMTLWDITMNNNIYQALWQSLFPMMWWDSAVRVTENFRNYCLVPPPHC